MKQLLAWLRLLWRNAKGGASVDNQMREEMQFHIDMEAARMEQRGLSASEARRQASIAFGGLAKYHGAGLDVLGLSSLRGFVSDMRLGGRMLRKSPGLTTVALFALSLAIGAGAAYREFTADLMHGQLPFADADRIVGIQTWDQESGGPEHRVTADFLEWRRAATSLESLAAYRSLDRNLITDDGRAEPVRGVEITAAAFNIARVPPLLGRPLIESDEQPGASPVVVIGYDLWTTRFGSNAQVIGRTIRIGAQTMTIVGVMPEGFGLPVSHSLWVPLRLAGELAARRDGPPTRVFAKLAPGATLAQAQAEFDALALSAATDAPATHGHLRVVVKPYVESLWSAVDDSRIQTIVLYAANVLFIALLSLCGANIATLVFARTATRETEISVRTALGASRARIAGQLFAEALVLSSVAAAIGLAFASYGLRWVKHAVAQGQGRPMMFWWNDRLSLDTIGYAAILAIVAAAIVGIIPAMKATSVNVQERLKQSTGATSSGLKFGGVWTAVIVTQVAVTVVFLAIVGMLGWSAYVTNGGERARNFPAAEFVTARLLLDQPSGQSDADHGRQLRAMFDKLAARVAVEPGIIELTYGTRLPGMNFLPVRIDVDGDPAGQARAVRTVTVATNYLETFGAPLLEGRAFSDSDLSPGHDVSIVDRTFARTIFGGGAAVGRHVRVAAIEGKEAGGWVEIVGVVGDLTDDTRKTATDAVLFRPASIESTRPLYVAAHARGLPAAAVSRLQIISADVEPSLRLTELQTLDTVGETDRVALDFFARLLAGVSLVATVLATAGVYALMSFTVARRTSEIGIRMALGGRPGRIVWSTFSRALLQVGGGLVAGSIPAGLIVANVGPEVSASNGNMVALAAGIFATSLVAIVTGVAFLVPARRALRIQPTDALKSN